MEKSSNHSDDNEYESPKSNNSSTYNNPIISNDDNILDLPSKFMLNILTTSLNLSKEKALILLSGDNNLLFDAIINGIKKNYDRVLKFFDMILINSSEWIKVYSESSEGLFNCLEIIKAGLISESNEVRRYSFNLMEKVSNELIKNGEIGRASCRERVYVLV